MLTNFKTENLHLSFLPAVLKETANDWYIEYYAEHPTSGEMKRFKVRMNRAIKRYTKKSEARKYCLDIVSRLNSRLMDGWSPFFESEDARLYMPLCKVVETYLAEKKKELRKDSMRCYTSITGIFLSWVAVDCPNVVCSLFNKAKAVRFMDYIYNDRGVSARTYNDYLKLMRSFFEWCVGKGYTKENPFVQFKTKKKAEKTRIMIDSETRARITEHLNGKPFLLVCMLVYHSLIRPKEIRMLKVRDINLQEHFITVSGEIAKNHHTRHCAISSQIESLIAELGIMNHNKDFYLFSDPVTLMPGSAQLYDCKFTKEFARLRKELKLPKEMQLYSFRDTGIYEMLKANVDDLSVMQHADHSSLDITTIYANHHDPKLAEIINKKTPKF